jgi:hypothetical protein
VANTRLCDIATRINILRGIPHESTRISDGFIGSLDDIQRLADQVRGMPPFFVQGDTFAMFDQALDQLERSASIETLFVGRMVLPPTDSEEDSEKEPNEPDHGSDSDSAASEQLTSMTQEQPNSPRQPDQASTPPLSPESPPPHHSTTTEQITTRRNIISSLETILASPDATTRETFSPVRQAMDEMSALLEEARDDQPDATVLDLVSDAQWLFWRLARRAFPGAETAGMARPALSLMWRWGNTQADDPKECKREGRRD